MDLKGRILLVEDLRKWRVQVRRLLQDYPCEITGVDSFVKATDLLQHHVYDLVLLDLRLTDWQEGTFEGWELMKRLQELRAERGTQVILMSAYGEPEHVRQGFKNYQIHDYVDKKRLLPQEFKASVAEAVEMAYRERGEILDR